MKFTAKHILNSSDYLHFLFRKRFNKSNQFYQRVDQLLFQLNSADTSLKNLRKIKNQTIASLDMSSLKARDVYMRPSSSDFLVFLQVFGQKEYKAPIELYQRVFGSDPKTILDIGANIGLTSLYLHYQFPESEIIAFEPSEENFTQLQKNLSNLSITSKKSAFWHSRAQLSLDKSFRDGNEWSFQFKESANGSVEGLGIKDIINEYNIHQIDFLKVDIEGGEFEIFNEDVDPLSTSVDIHFIVMEIHEDCGEKSKILKYFERYDYAYEDFGETTCFYKVDHEV